MFLEATLETTFVYAPSGAAAQGPVEPFVFAVDECEFENAVCAAQILHDRLTDLLESLPDGALSMADANAVLYLSNMVSDHLEQARTTG